MFLSLHAIYSRMVSTVQCIFLQYSVLYMMKVKEIGARLSLDPSNRLMAIFASVILTCSGKQGRNN